MNENQATPLNAVGNSAGSVRAELCDAGAAETVRQNCIAAKHLLEPIYGATNYAPIGGPIAKSLDHLDKSINALSAARLPALVAAVDKALAASNALIADEWRVSSEWGPRSERNTILEEAISAIAILRALQQEMK